jgi:Concanavalin A-like lectin/glucanases superfamily
MRTTAPRLYKPPVGTQLDQGAPLARSLGCCLDFNEMAGPPHDASGNGNTGTINGGVTWAQNGNWGSCLSFNGSTGYLSFPAASTGLTGATSATFSIWCRPTQTGTQAILCGNLQNSPITGEWYLRYAATGAFNFRNYYNSGNASATSATTYSANTWYHVVGVSTPSTIYLYVDGAQAATATQTTSWTSVAGLTVGAVMGAVGNVAELFWQGQLDGFRVWSRALAASEIAQLYANYWQIYTPPLPVAWWANQAPSFLPWYLGDQIQEQYG